MVYGECNDSRFNNCETYRCESKGKLEEEPINLNQSLAEVQIQNSTTVNTLTQFQFPPYKPVNIDILKHT
jgi:hypothetical protein